MIRRAIIKDIEAIKSLAIELWKESNFSEIELDMDNLDNLISGFISSDSTAVYVSEKQSSVVGFVIVVKEQSYTKKPMAHLYMIYVKQNYRNSDIGTLLLESSINQVVNWGVCVYFVGVASGLETDGKLINMYLNHGFEKVGTYYRRVI